MSLESAPGVQIVDTPNFPAEYKVEASAMRDVLTELLKETELSWTYISPSALYAPGIRTGKFRIGRNNLLVNPMGESRISMEDFA